MPLIPKNTPPYYTTDELGQPTLYYTANLNQTGTDAPIATVRKNTFTGTWTRDALGVYKFTFTTPILKSRLYIPGGNTWDGTLNETRVLNDGASIQGYINIYANANGANYDAIFVDIWTEGWVLQEMSSAIKNLNIELIVYPT